MDMSVIFLEDVNASAKIEEKNPECMYMYAQLTK